MTDFGSKTMQDLRELARARQIPGRGEMNKQQLVRALEEADLSARVAALEERVESLERRASSNMGELIGD